MKKITGQNESVQAYERYRSYPLPPYNAHINHIYMLVWPYTLESN